MKVRYYGFFAVRNKNRLKILRERLFVDASDILNNNETSKSIPLCCPKCGNPMILVETFSKIKLPRAP